MRNKGFSLLELLVAMTVLIVLLGLLFTLLDQVLKGFVSSEQKISASSRARSVVELITRELTPAVVDTRMQFVVLPAEDLRASGASTVAPNTPVLLWMAPIGAGGELRCVGYYLDHNQALEKYRLKRLFIRPDNSADYFPELFSLTNARDLSNRTNPTTADWFLDGWDENTFDDIDAANTDDVVSTVADGTLGFWVQCYDSLGEPIPWLSESSNHPESELMFNSASYFHMASGKAFDDDTSFVYLRETPQVVKAHRLPAEVEIAIFTVGDDVISRLNSTPPIEQVLTSSGSLDIEASINRLKQSLESMGETKGELFTIRVKLNNGG